MAEDVSHTMHNLYTLRGSEVRDGNLWSRYIGEALDVFGDKTDVVDRQHTWPVAAASASPICWPRSATSTSSSTTSRCASSITA